MNITSYVKACYPIIYVVTPEESRAELMILNTARELDRKLSVWSYTDGFKEVTKQNSSSNKIVDPTTALFHLRDAAPSKEGEIIVMRDLHMFFNNPKVVRLLRDIANAFKKNRKTLIIVSPIKKTPPELERDITIIDLDLPSREEIKTVFESLYSPKDAGARAKVREAVGEISDEEQEKVVQAAMGLTFIEADNAFAKAFIEYSADKIQPLSRLVLKEKAIAVKKSGILEYFEPKQTVDHIGGLENLKTWLRIRSNAFGEKARQFGLPVPRGILLVGLPGCGKSLSAKVASSILGLPLLKFDIGRVFAGLVGHSEQNMRNAIATAESIGSAVIWVDELEKAFAGSTSVSASNGGTTQRIFGNFLTWLQEKTVPCFVIATVNKIDNLPPELLRKGRFDEIFFVGLPNKEEREQILRVHLKMKNQKISQEDFNRCVQLSEGFSGAEIEEAVVAAMYSAFDQDRELTGNDIINAIQITNPLSQSRADELSSMADWAKNNAMNASKVLPEMDVPNIGRQLQF
jgi:SpoVK/Ycf46/Vps4 family AAA+-type ATPase